MIPTILRRSLSDRERERIELHYWERADPAFAQNTYTSLIYKDQPDRTIVTLYAAPEETVSISVDDLLAWAEDPQRQRVEQKLPAPPLLMPTRLRPVSGGVLGLYEAASESRLIVVRITGTIEYMGDLVSADVVPKVDRYSIYLTRTVTRAVQLAGYARQLSRLVNGPTSWEVHANIRNAHRAMLGDQARELLPLPGDHTCHDRHLQVTADLDTSDDRGHWQLGLDLDLALSHAYGFRTRRGHNEQDELVLRA